MTIDDEIKGRFRNEYHKGLINLTYTTKQLGYEFLQALKKHEATEQQYSVLRIVRGFRAQAPLSISFIKERMLDKDSDVSRIVDRLFLKGMVNRKENSADRRVKSIEITDNGLELLNNMLECEKKVDTLLEKLTLEEVTTLNAILDKIRS